MPDTPDIKDTKHESLPEYQERIKIDLVTFMLKRMVEDVTNIEQRAEFMNACVAAAAILAAGQSVFLAGQCKSNSKRASIIDTGRKTALNITKEAYDSYIAAIEWPNR